MGVPYEKMSTIETPSSSAVLVDGPVDVQQPAVRIRHYFVFSLFSAICLCPATGNKCNLLNCIISYFCLVLKVLLHWLIH
ncbi:unnamed protein product [Rotaria sp. Silwood2]|nr:unnamed protein product [Rotaria sp. Silwood2]